MTARATVTEELSKLGLATMTFDDDGCLSEALPEVIGQRLCDALQARGVNCEWSEDRRDQSMVWVQVFEAS